MMMPPATPTFRLSKPGTSSTVGVSTFKRPWQHRLTKVRRPLPSLPITCTKAWGLYGQQQLDSHPGKGSQ